MIRYLKIDNRLDFAFIWMGASVPSRNVSNDRRSESSKKFQKELKEHLEKDYSDKKFPTEKGLFVCIQINLNSKKQYKSKDLDNHIKDIIDAMTGIVYKDDVQISTLLVYKTLVDKEPSFAITGRILENGDEDKELISGYFKLLKERGNKKPN